MGVSVLSYRVSAVVLVLSLIGLILLASMGCQHTQPAPSPAPTLDVVAADLNRATEATTEALDELDAVPQMPPEAAKPIATIRASNEAVKAAVPRLEAASKAAKAVAVERDRLKDASASKAASAMTWLTVSGVIAAAVCIALFAAGVRPAIYGAIGGTATVAAAMFVTAATPIIPWLVLAVSVLGVGYLGYQLWTHRRAIAGKK